MNISEKEIEGIVRQVIAGMAVSEASSGMVIDGKTYLGVFEDMNDAIDAAWKAQKKLYDMSVEEKEEIISAIRRLILEEAETLARLGVSETGMGRVEHKILKHRYVAQKTPGTEDLVTEAITGDKGLTLLELAPFGVIGAMTPSTNPSETVLCNSIGMIAGSNTVVFNPHPGALMTSLYAVDLVNRAARSVGAPENLAVAVRKPTMETSDIMMKSPKVRMICCTGGPGVVRAVLSSGKKAIGAGAGNPPVIVDDTADIQKAGRDIIDGCTFDNNLPCIAEKEVFAFESITDELIYYMSQNGAYLISREQMRQLEGVVLVEDKKGKKAINKNWVGRDAKKILHEIGIEVGEEIRCVICEAQFDDPFVQIELMMPILPIVRVPDIDTAIDLAVRAEHGLRHTAHMHSKNIDHLTKFARAIETTIFVKNAPSYAGIGVGGEGHCTFTIAGPTGEGLTSAKSFCRRRRCAMVDSFRIV
ncbi:aldehyde dehydrogenase family protein [Anaerotruncus massiliensis (ex Togo et al. 2019)]|uniref:aldehyde dehydrogenase family protein n=1 Tax=Anaerotruncus TaxID=244127 RepID=UPI000C77FBBF|nr:aldehyde dehydrogenase family protein [Anaerotruncus massiliensis (ex Togo et al. 2019)]